MGILSREALSHGVLMEEFPAVQRAEASTVSRGSLWEAAVATGFHPRLCSCTDTILTTGTLMVNNNLKFFEILKTSSGGVE